MQINKKTKALLKQTITYKFFNTFYYEAKDWFETVGFMTINLLGSLRAFKLKNVQFKYLLDQSVKVGIDSLPITLLMVSITGMIIALQVAHEMVKQGAGDYVGMLVAVSIVRELSPVIGSFAVIFLVGSSMSAEIATMKVTEQIDAMKVAGVDPIDYLIAPRVIAGFFIMPFVIIIANLVGILGGMLMSKMVSDLNCITYLGSVWHGLTVKDVISSVVKASVFGGIITLTSASIGYKAKGGAIDVGKATTRAVVWSFVSILIADYIISLLFFN